MTKLDGLKQQNVFSCNYGGRNLFKKYLFMYFNWRIIALQYFDGFAIHQYESIIGPLHAEAPSHLPLHPVPSSRLSQSMAFCALLPTPNSLREIPPSTESYKQWIIYKYSLHSLWKELKEQYQSSGYFLFSATWNFNLIA